MTSRPWRAGGGWRRGTGEGCTALYKYFSERPCSASYKISVSLDPAGRRQSISRPGSGRETREASAVGRGALADRRRRRRDPWRSDGGEVNFRTVVVVPVPLPARGSLLRALIVFGLWTTRSNRHGGGGGGGGMKTFYKLCTLCVFPLPRHLPPDHFGPSPSAPAPVGFSPEFSKNARGYPDVRGVHEFRKVETRAPGSVGRRVETKTKETVLYMYAVRFYFFFIHFYFIIV